MKPGVAIALLLVVLLPAGLFVASAVRMQADRQVVLEHQLAKYRQQSLELAEQPLAAWFYAQAQRLDDAMLQVPLTTPALRQLVRTAPAVRQALQIDMEGTRLFPPTDLPLTQQEQAFLERTRLLWQDHGILYPAAGEGQTMTHGWYTWYWGDEMNLIRWVLRENGTLLGVELEPARLVSDLINQLPESAPPGSHLRLRNERGAVIYQWGTGFADASALPFAVRLLQAPLSSWRLEYFEKHNDGTDTPPLWLLALVSVACLVMLALAGYLYRAHRREMEIAGQRVSFVNQVSHELKTPLTNIRMYSELLERELPEEEARSHEYLDIIITESERLTRLIANVLSFARVERRKLAVSPRPTCINEVLAGILQKFQPILAQAGIQVTTRLPAMETAMLDADALEQILNNLIGNVEKYAASGGSLQIDVSREGDTLTVRLADAGPGIPVAAADRIFDAFYRVDHGLASSAAGTGIGLTVARELAQQHGGNLQLLDTTTGTCFLLTLHAPKVQENV